MIPMAGNPGTADTSILSEPTFGSTPDVLETVASLDCRGRTTALLYREVELLLQRHGERRGALFLMVRHVERVDGSLTGFVLALEAILRTSRVPVLLGDLSGVVPLVLSCVNRDTRFRVAPQSPLPRQILIVDPSQASAGLLRSVLEMFGQTCTPAANALEARQAVASRSYDLVLLDLELPRMQSFGLAEFLRSSHPSTAVIGITGREEVWHRETSERYGFRRILSKPYSVLEVIGALHEVSPGRAG